MLGRRKRSEVDEHEAEGEIERVYHEIRQVLRVSGIALIFRTWAGYGRFLPVMWDAVRPNLEAVAFEDAADEVRSEAVRLADALGRLDVPTRAAPGDSQAYQIRAALDLYHYINPKLLVLASAVKGALEGTLETVQPGSTSKIPRGVPLRMVSMEMIEGDGGDDCVPGLFQDIKQTLSLPSINSDYRTLALWPEYLSAGWRMLKPVVQSDAYRTAADRLRDIGRQGARKLPHHFELPKDRVREIGEDPDEIYELTSRFELLLPSLILNICLFSLDWKDAPDLRRSPFPLSIREGA